MNVILLERLPNLGAIGDVVAVKPGFARNYLLPQGKAKMATAENLAFLEAEKQRLLAAEAETIKAAEAQAAVIHGATISLQQNADEAGKLFGSVTPADIEEALAERLGQTVARKHIALADAIKELGTYTIAVHLHPEVQAEFTLVIERA